MNVKTFSRTSLNPTPTLHLLALVVALLLSLLSLLPGVDALPVSASSPRPHRVLVLGDSLTLGTLSTGLLGPQSSESGYSLLIDAKNGASTYSTPDSIKKHLSKSSTRKNHTAGNNIDLILVALGTNDATHWISESWFRARVEKIMKASGNTPVLWIDVRLSKKYPAADSLNRVLREVASRNPRLTILPWSEASASHRLSSDGIHLDRKGYTLRARFMSDALRAYFKTTS